MAATLVRALALSAVIPFAAAQLSETVGPTTSTKAKAATKVCNILDYGGKASATTDNGDAIAKAWAACQSGGQVLIPEGDYGLENFVSLDKGEGVSINLLGTIYRTGTGTGGGNMISVSHTSDFEFYSGNSQGAIQGHGYEFHRDGKDGPRILRCTKCVDFSVHDVVLVDAPAFHLSLDTCERGEVYNMVIRGASKGGLDGIDVWGSNIWVHDVEVTNKDECVTVKNPSNNILVEQIFCNWSGGCAMGSLGSDIAISDIKYDSVYTQNANQMYMFKSNGGNGDVSNVALSNFVGHTNAYTLDFDTAWSSMAPVAGDGIAFTNISFAGWRGTCADGTSKGRPPIKMNCPPAVPCTDITIQDFDVWTESGDEVAWVCQNAFGSGACLNTASATSAYTTTVTQTTVTGYAYTTMPGELTEGFATDASIPVPTMPASFFPGKPPISAFASAVATSGAAA